jgi:hypothetical protein
MVYGETFLRNCKFTLTKLHDLTVIRHGQPGPGNTSPCTSAKILEERDTRALVLLGNQTWPAGPGHTSPCISAEILEEGDARALSTTRSSDMASGARTHISLHISRNIRRGVCQGPEYYQVLRHGQWGPDTHLPAHQQKY